MQVVSAPRHTRTSSSPTDPLVVAGSRNLRAKLHRTLPDCGERAPCRSVGLAQSVVHWGVHPPGRLQPVVHYFLGLAQCTRASRTDRPRAGVQLFVGALQPEMPTVHVKTT